MWRQLPQLLPGKRLPQEAFFHFRLRQRDYASRLRLPRYSKPLQSVQD